MERQWRELFVVREFKFCEREGEGQREKESVDGVGVIWKL